MKLLILHTTLFISMTFITFGQIIEFEDPDFKAKLVANLLINTDFDEEITEAEAAAFTGEINVSFVSSLSGIEKFMNLTELVCSRSELTSIDLSSIPLLTNLSITYASIETLDLSVCPLLERVILKYLDISSVDISKNQAIETLHLTDNDLLTSIDISQNPNLLYFHCNDNKNLTSLDLSVSSNLRHLNCNGCSITNLDITACTSLSLLYCMNNGMRSLDMRNGNNVIMNSNTYVMTSSNYLTCISVDNAAWSEASWSYSDPGTVYSENCTVGIQERKRIRTEDIRAIYDIRGAWISKENFKSLPKGLYFIRSKDGRTEKRIIQ